MLQFAVAVRKEHMDILIYFLCAFYFKFLFMRFNLISFYALCVFLTLSAVCRGKES